MKNKIYVIFQDPHHYQQSGSCDTIKEAEDWANEIDNEDGDVIGMIRGIESNPMVLDQYILDFGNSKPKKSDKIYVACCIDRPDEDYYRIEEFGVDEEDKVLKFLQEFEKDDEGDYVDDRPETVIRGKKLNLVEQKRYVVKEKK